MIKGLQAKWGACSRTVSFDHTPLALTYWEDLIAVGSSSGDIIILDAITGTPISVFSSHTNQVKAVAFSSDGRSLVSGGYGMIINLWDVQTGGVIKTFCGHTNWIYSVSISPDCANIASGSWDNTIRLWDTQAGVCHCVIEGHSADVYSISFSPTNSQLLMSASRGGTVQQWDTKGHKIGSAYEGNCVVFSPDGTKFVLWNYEGTVATVQDSGSGEVITKLQSPSGNFYCCCLSPDGKFMAGSVDNTIYIWDIISPDPHLVETLIGHTSHITSLAFSSSLISLSQDQSIKFWQTGVSSVDPAAVDPEPTQLSSASIESISLQKAGMTVTSSNSAGVIKTWDILTGLCKESFQSTAKDSGWGDTQLIDGRLTFVWLEYKAIQIWDTGKGELLQTLNVPYSHWQVKSLRISGDGSRIFFIVRNSIHAWSIQAREVVGEVELKKKPLYDSLVVDGSRVWVYFEDSQAQGWDFGLSGSIPSPLSNTLLGRPYLCFMSTWQQDTRVEGAATRKEVFQLSGRYAMPKVARWDGQYLVAGYRSGEVLIMDFSHMIPQ